MITMDPQQLVLGIVAIILILIIIKLLSREKEKPLEDFSLIKGDLGKEFDRRQEK